MRPRTLLYLAVVLAILHPNQSFAIIKSWNKMAPFRRAKRNHEELRICDTEEKESEAREENTEGWWGFWDKIFFRV